MLAEGESRQPGADEERPSRPVGSLGDFALLEDGPLRDAIGRSERRQGEMSWEAASTLPPPSFGWGEVKKRSAFSELVPKGIGSLFRFGPS